MLLKFFKRTLPLVLSSVILIGALLWLKSFVSASQVPVQFETNQMPLYALLHKVVGNNMLISKLIGFAIMLFVSLYLIQFNSQHILIKNRTYLPALIYILLTSSFNVIHGINPASFAGFFLVVTLHHLFTSYDKRMPYHNLFMAGFFVALASLFYLPSTIFLVLVFIAIMVTRPLNLRDWIVTVTGFSTPWFFVFMYHYIFNSNIFAINTLIYETWDSLVQIHPKGIVPIILLAINSILLLISLFNVFRFLPTQKINIRKFHGILLWFMFFTGVIIAYPPTRSIEMVYIAAIPLSFFFSHFLSFTRNRFWPEFFLISLIILSAIMQFA
jgi:hypothetical protein